MAVPRVLVLRSPGTNCDEETAYAFELAGGLPERVHVNRLLEEPALLGDFQVLCLPGGFSYGDDIAAGRILAARLEHHLADALNAFRDAGKLVLGICNGFQVLIKSGILLPRDNGPAPAATLTWNDTRRYQCRWAYLRTDGEKSVFLRGIDRMYLPVAHAEGKFVTRDAETFAQLDAAQQLALRYAPAPALAAVGAAGKSPLPFPTNPNGSIGDVAGICDPTGRVLGLMPHPERHIDPTQHPRWTRGEAGAEGDGLAIFRNAIQFFAS